MALNYVTVTGTFDDATGNPLTSGTVTFTPSQDIYAAGVPLVTTANPIVCPIIAGALKNPAGGTLTLLATDNAGVTIEGMSGFWFWQVTIAVAGDQQSWQFFLPHAPSTVDLYATANTTTPTAFFPTVVALSNSAGTVAVNAVLGNDFRLTLTASGWTIAAPTNPQDGQEIWIVLTQDVSGSRTVTWTTSAGGYDFGTAGSPTLSTGGGKVDVVRFHYNAALNKWMCLGSSLGF